MARAARTNVWLALGSRDLCMSVKSFQTLSSSDTLLWTTVLIVSAISQSGLKADHRQAFRIDASNRPYIHVNFLERVDHDIFDINFSGIFIQCCISLCGYVWMYGLTRRPKLSVLAALPPFLLNLLYLGTHSLCAALDVFVCLRKQDQFN